MFTMLAGFMVLIFSASSAVGGALSFADGAHPLFQTSVEEIDVTTEGFGRYDVFFVSGREQIVDGWSTMESSYATAISQEMYPNVVDSAELAHLIKRYLVQLFNNLSVINVSGKSGALADDYEFNTDSEENQYLLIPYMSDGECCIGGTFLTKELAPGLWGPDDLVGNLFSATRTAGSRGFYWVIVTSAIGVNEPNMTGAVLFFVIMFGMLSVYRKYREGNRLAGAAQTGDG